MGFNSGSQSSSSNASGYAYNNSLAQSINAAQSSVWAPQAQQLTNLYGQAAGLAAERDDHVTAGEPQRVDRSLDVVSRRSDRNHPTP